MGVTKYMGAGWGNRIGNKCKSSSPNSPSLLLNKGNNTVSLSGMGAWGKGTGVIAGEGQTAKPGHHCNPARQNVNGWGGKVPKLWQ